MKSFGGLAVLLVLGLVFAYGVTASEDCDNQGAGGCCGKNVNECGGTGNDDTNVGGGTGSDGTNVGGGTGSDDTNVGGGTGSGDTNVGGGTGTGGGCHYHGSCGGSSAHVCNNGARDAEFPNKQKKYTVFNTGKTWYEADLHCKSHCMALATAMSQQDQHYLEAAVPADGQDVWLGGMCPTSRNCKWQNTKAYINSYYKNWARGEPEIQPHGHFGPKFNCVAYSSRSQQWTTGACSDPKPFVCQSFK